MTLNCTQSPFTVVELDAGGNFTMPTDMRFRPSALIGYKTALFVVSGTCCVTQFVSIICMLLFVFSMVYCTCSFCSLQRAHCAICTDRIWGLGRQGYKCINCKLLVHKKCHKLVTVECGRQVIQVSNLHPSFIFSVE